MNLQNQIDYLIGIKNQDMFDGCTVPDGLDMSLVRGAIVMRCGLLTPLFSEPETQRAATQQFFAENQWNFLHVLNIVKAEYSPIENVFEERREIEKQTGENENRLDITKGTDITTRSGISAENSVIYQPDRESIESERGTDTQIRNGEDKRNVDRTVNRRGNVGTTTNQYMINEELDLLTRFNPYRFIADLYEKQLMLGIY